MGRTSKFRGSRTHGRGKKAGRGAGKRGGRGNAGLHKHRYITTVKDMPDHFGRRGFSPQGRRGGRGGTISLRTLEGRVDALVANGIGRMDGDTFEIDLGKIGVRKLVAGGRPERKMRLKVACATPGAIARVREAGGEVQTSEAHPSDQEMSGEGAND